GKLIEGPELPIEIRGADKQQSSRGNNGPAVIVAARILQSFCGQFGKLSERNFPADGTRVQVEGYKHSPGGRDRRITIRVAEKRFSVAAILEPVWIIADIRVRPFINAGHQILDEIVGVAGAHIRESRHTSGSVSYDLGNFFPRMFLLDPFQGRCGRRPL